MSQQIPIVLTPVSVPVGVTYTNIDQLLVIVARYLQGQISSDVTFVETGMTDPTQMTTLLFFNLAQGVWKYWDVGLGKYIASTQFQIGDTKISFIGVDQPQQGWILLDGRAISAVPNISQTQMNALTNLFGIDGDLPTVTPVSSLQGLPVDGSISNIPVADIQPPDGQIGALPFAVSYDATQPKALGANTETLRDSAAALQVAVKGIQTQTEAMLNSLNQGSTSSTPLFAAVFVGYP